MLLLDPGMRGLTKIATLLVTLAVIGVVVAACIAAIVQPFVRPTPSMPPPVDPERLETHVRRLSVDFHPRRYDRLDNIGRTVQYITGEMKATVWSGGIIAVLPAVEPAS